MIDLSHLKPRNLNFSSRNAIVYAVNDNQTYVDCMVNSINSICVNSREILDGTCFFVITDKNIDLSRLRPEAASRTRILADLSYDYGSFPMRSRHTKYTFFRYEIFGNPIFRQFDNVLYLDVDTVVEKSLFELMVKPGSRICMVEEMLNFLKKQGMNAEHYCNAGFILITPKTIGSIVLDDMFKFLVERSRQRSWRMNDQDVLNLMLADERWTRIRQILDSGWNYGYTTVEKAPPSGQIRIRHFISSQGRYPKKYL